jgi:YHS domain-containing protein
MKKKLQIVGSSLVLANLLLFSCSGGNKQPQPKQHDHQEHMHHTSKGHMDHQKLHKDAKAKIIKQTYAQTVKVGDTTKCPVMGTKFTVNKNSLSVMVNGKKYYICCEACRKPLKKNPDKYLKTKQG